MAEGKDPKSKGLLGERGQRGRNFRLGVGQLKSTFLLGLHDAVLGRQILVPRQQIPDSPSPSRRPGGDVPVSVEIVK